jgi:hypothetical protein
MKRLLTCICVLAILPLFAGNLSTELKLESTTFKLDKVHSAKALAAQIKIKQRKFGQPPKPVAIVGELILKNTGKDPVTINIAGDMSMITLSLAGEGALTMHSMMMMTADFRMGKDLTIKPGESHSFKLTSLAHGKRGMSQYSYWTKAGKYKLSASYKSKKDIYTSKEINITVN